MIGMELQGFYEDFIRGSKKEKLLFDFEKLVEELLMDEDPLRIVSELRASGKAGGATDLESGTQHHYVQAMKKILEW